MKKRMIVLMLSCLWMGLVNAQVTTWKHGTTTPAGTFANSAADTSSIQKSQPFKLWGIQVKVTRNSGTLGGTTILYKSNYSNGPWFPTDTLTLTNVAVKGVYWEKTSPVGMYWMAVTTGTGTMNATAEITSVGWRPEQQ